MGLNSKSTLESALTQVIVAFGHGLGGLMVSPGAAKAGVDRFRPAVEQNLENWDQNLPALTSYATLIGRVTALKTLDRGANLVTARDFLGALRTIEKDRQVEKNRQGERRFGCPFFHHHRR